MCYYQIIHYNLLTLLLLFSCSSMNSKSEPISKESIDLYNWNKSKGLDYTFLGRGINLGNYLDSSKNDTEVDGEGSWNGGRKILKADIDRIASVGFAHVRLPVRWSDYLTDEEPYSFYVKEGYDRVFRVKEILEWIKKAGLRVVLDVHHFDELYSAGSESEMTKQKNRLIAIWDILSKEFPLSDYPSDFLVFELCNEPHDKFTAEEWNSTIPKLTDTIWNQNSTSQNNDLGQRKIMIGSAEWGGVSGYRKLVIPDECTAENTIATIHFYEPFEFTHQGAEWSNGADEWIGTRWRGSDEEKQSLYVLMDYLDSWNTKGFEIYMGEFGVYSKFSKKEDQTLWTSFIARESERRGYSWAYWEYSAGFGAFNAETGSWRSQLIKALIPKSR